MSNEKVKDSSSTYNAFAAEYIHNNNQCTIVDSIAEIVANSQKTFSEGKRTLMCGSKIANNSIDLDGLTKSLAVEFAITGIFSFAVLAIGGASSIPVVLGMAGMAAGSAFVNWGVGRLLKAEDFLSEEMEAGIQFAASAVFVGYFNKKATVELIISGIGGFVTGLDAVLRTKDVKTPDESKEATKNIALESGFIESVKNFFVTLQHGIGAVNFGAPAIGAEVVVGAGIAAGVYNGLGVGVGVYKGLELHADYISAYAQAADYQLSCLTEDLYFV